LEGCEEKVRKKCGFVEGEMQKKVKGLGSRMKWEKLAKAHRELKEKGGEGMTEKRVRELMEGLKPMIVSPIDKYPAELAVM